ncbi:MAG: DJ-1/PfpI family protein [Lachnospiraceae bacterium]|nr:DJ-1/PfpI family protein [Lachnospiraceae bacterium]
MSKVCVFFAEGYEEIEALTVVDILRRAGIDTETVSVTGNKTVTSSHRIPVVMDKLFEDVDFASVDMLVLPGGMPGTKNLEAHAPLMEQVDAFYESGKYVAAICAAPSILGHRGMLKGKRACAFPDFESHLEGARVTKDSVEQDGHVITSRGMGCAIDFSLKIVAVFNGQEAADALAEKIVYTR